MADIDLVNDLSKKYGLAPEQSDVAALSAKAPEDRNRFIADLEAQFQRRAAPTSHRPNDSQTTNPMLQMANSAADRGMGFGTGGPFRPPVMQQAQAPAPSLQAPPSTAQFSDPLSKQVEQSAMQQAQRLEAPPADSGQFALEQALKSIAAQFQQGGYTTAEQEIYQTQAIDPLERLRTTRRQQVMLELSKRGIDPKSGVGMSMLADVDRQFDQQRTVLQRDVAGKAADERTSRMLKAVELLSGLAGTQDQRQAQAFQYRTVPYNLGQTAFQNARQVANDNDPLRLAGPYAQMASLQNQQDQFNRSFNQRDQQFQQQIQFDYDRLNAGDGDSQASALADLLWMITRGGR